MSWVLGSNFDVNSKYITGDTSNLFKNFSGINIGLSNTILNSGTAIGTGNVATGLLSCAIGGGNSVWSSYSTIVGGSQNVISGINSFIGGGYNNVASGDYATIGGGSSNTSSGNYATVGGGSGNKADIYSSVVGGTENTIINSTIGYNFIGGGKSNLIDNCSYSLSNGNTNQIINSDNSVLCGGIFNTINDSNYSSVLVGGNNDIANTTGCLIAGGENHQIVRSTNSLIVGGDANSIADSVASFIGGGSGNLVNTDYATIIAGVANRASGLYSTVLGGYYGDVSHYGELSHAAGAFSQAGDAQHMILVARNQTTDASSGRLFLDGVNKEITIPTGTTWMFNIKLAGCGTGLTGTYGAKYNGCISNHNIAGSPDLGGNPDFEVSYFKPAGMTWTSNVQADNVNKSLAISVTGAAGTTINWCAVIDITQVQNFN